MEQFATEEQQVEAIKKFMKDNGAAIVIGAVLGLGGLWGWRYYSDTQRVAKEEASAAYQAAVQAIEADGNTEKLDNFIAQTENTGYATIGGLVAAQQAVNAGDLDLAKMRLSEVQSTTADPHLATMAGIRLARVQIELGEVSDALNTLSALNDNAFAAKISEVKGDAYVAQEKFDDARLAYSQALEKAAGNVLLEMKLDNLPALASN
ncbi:tetratricopeptide repeat protein [Aestuariibacter sp. A3R04]|uniref:YfgM family protein n=1 Tax=Aestuariibacter sp. A3R04 TaxID=2841571 RepID=UPI001C0843F1|nr:tetratricopeptide repeat protein [Aestuariibacter sp. A3R04]MBU3021814.1 tetratricopeptide repeat protein [Aestuariibacter sp. A3R04]